MTRTITLILRNLMFTVVVPGLGGAWLPWEIMTRGGHTVTPTAWPAVPVIVAGVALYGWCVWNFAAVGPYRWVRNPIYLAALLIVLGQAWLFLAPQLLAYAAVMAVFFHLFITGYEERTLDRRFGRAYQDYRATVPRWIPHHPS
jgi:protein-S-isoprenylcysteine O-methyltransferase Ste14